MTVLSIRGHDMSENYPRMAGASLAVALMGALIGRVGAWLETCTPRGLQAPLTEVGLIAGMFVCIAVFLVVSTRWVAA